MTGISTIPVNGVPTEFIAVAFFYGLGLGIVIGLTIAALFWIWKDGQRRK
jgi:hypothetical protein